MYSKSKFGIGTFALVICLMGILFCLSFGQRAVLGDRILNYIGLQAWSKGSDGIHYTIFYSFLFFVPAVFLGFKFREDIGAKMGARLSLIITVLILLAMPFVAL